ncbi:alpha/beta hydrolase [Nocardioides yefusunii]|uniref:Alpha/beta hydrolase n=1 Tax=Nocardioides yefusunii TaxID=2500546 RepID=A0ABW1R0G3_9ACTN|nr:alpha/beta hydrolase [Nocardioides yefusunii]
MLTVGYYVYGWVELGEAYAKLVKTGDGTDLLAEYAGPGDDNGFAVYNGVQCTDAQWPSWQKTRRDAARLHAEHPFLTWGNTWYNAPCLNWPAKSHRAFKVDGSKVRTPILLVAETHDAATVYSGALATRKEFPTASLIEGVGGTTHSGSLSGIDCTDDAIATYLDTGVAPQRVKGKNRSDLQCDPVPVPEPEPVVSGGAALSRSASPSAAALTAAPAASTRDRVPADVRAALQQAQRQGQGAGR